MFLRHLRQAGQAGLLALATLLAACGGGSDPASGSSSATGGQSSNSLGQLAISLTDSQGCDYKSVWVTVEQVRIHKDSSAGDGDGGWLDLNLSPARRVDLLTLRNGVFVDLGTIQLPAGKYTQVRLVLATNENDVLDEFFRTGIYRPRTTAETHVTSSPSMDISKASNFERFIFDLVGRDAAIVRELWREVDAGGSFSLAGGPFGERLPSYGFVSGSSSHADRLATIRDVWQRHGLMIDTHTADGIKVAKKHRVAGMPMIVLETAQAVKFAETIREALGRDPVRPAELEGLEDLPQKVEVVDAAVNQVKDIIVRHC